MTAKELRRAAENVLGIVNDPLGWTGKIKDSNRLAEHIMAIVRDDDDEPVTLEWVLDRDPFSFMEIDGGIWCILTDSFLPIDMTRGEFRALCKGLRIVLDSPPPG